MKKLLLLVVVAMSSVAYLHANDAVVVNQEEIRYEEVNFVDVASPAPKFKLAITLQMGDPKEKCDGWWPVCEFKISFDSDIVSTKGLRSIFEVYDNEIIICISKKDINNLGSAEPRKKLLNVRSVKFGADAEFPEELAAKCGTKGFFGIRGNQTYNVTSDVNNVYIHVPY